MRPIYFSNVLNITIHTTTNLNGFWPTVLHIVQNSLLLAIVKLEVFHILRLNTNNLEGVLWPESPIHQTRDLCKAKPQIRKAFMDTDYIA